MDSKTLMPGVRPKEVWAWSAFDFANSGYTTVVLTAVFNAYFVAVVAGDAPWATFVWTLIIAASNAASLVLMPVIGAIADATAKLESGELHVFDCSTFTVDGQPVTSYMADVDTDPDYTPDTEAIVDGYFAESTFRSAPYFNVRIDGINLLDEQY